ncbi:MAG: hypothetical protein ABI877_16420 [Gemmatimonadaceae bacterium]
MRNQFQLVAEQRCVTTLEDSLIELMWRLFARYYDDVDRATFVRDLREKDHVLLLLDRERHTLAGFSTIKSYSRTIGERRVVVVFSGDTICDERFWGQRALHTAFLRYVLRVKIANPFTPVYWFLISKGYKTYLLLARNFPEFWPRHDRSTPVWQLQIIDELAREKYGEAWLPNRGVLHFELPAGRLHDGVAAIGATEREDAHIRFFHERNPQATSGDELCCLGRINAALAVNYVRRRLLRLVHRRARETGSITGRIIKETTR